MVTITLDLDMNMIHYKFEKENDFGFMKTYDGFIINRTSGKRVYMQTVKDGILQNSFFKTMKFENGNVFINFGKDKIKIGSYK